MSVCYYFLPAVRDGLAACLTNTELKSLRATVTATLTPTVDGTPQTVQNGDGSTSIFTITKELALFGAGDLVGFDPDLVVRQQPDADVKTFEPNMLPSIEFAETDWCWRFTGKAGTDSGLTPSVVLIVLVSEGTKKEFVDATEFETPTHSAHKNTTVPAGWIKGVQISSLPDLKDAHYWAHGQITGPVPGQKSVAEIKEELARWISNPDDSYANGIVRLICPRRLAPNTPYTAFVVPTFKVAQVRAGLITSLGETEHGLTYGWDKENNASGTVDLPYYYRWSFSTTVREDFEALIRKLEPREMPKVGKRGMACGDLQYGVPPVSVSGAPQGEESVLQFEGALRPPVKPGEKFSTEWGNDKPEVTSTQTKLAEVLNLPASVAASSNGMEPPPIVPPIYGRWHAGLATVGTEPSTHWLNDLNLDPRNRAAAGAGAKVVDIQQEPLMSALYEMLGDIDLANEVIRRGQLGIEASRSMHTRLGMLGQQDYLAAVAPLFKRTTLVQPSGGTTSVATYLSTSPIPSAAFDPAFRRIAGRRGSLRKRQKPAKNKALGGLFSRLNDGTLAAAGPAPRISGAPNLCEVTMLALERLKKNQKNQKSQKSKSSEAKTPSAGNGNDFCEEAITCARVYGATKGGGSKILHEQGAMAFCNGLSEWLNVKDVAPNKQAVDLEAIRKAVHTATDPTVTIAARINTRIKHGPGVVRTGPMSTLRARIEFPQAMYEPLRDLDRSFILPGLDQVPQETITVVESNRAGFIEPYLIGLSHSFAVEAALWRSAPVYLWTTFFRQFWSVDDLVDGTDREKSKDLTHIHEWAASSQLGEHNPREVDATSPSAERAVVLLKSSLFQRYPRTLIYLVKAQANGMPELEEYMDPGATVERSWPTFSGSMPPDVNFFGFNHSVADLCTRYVVLEERLTDPKFGADVPSREDVAPVDQLNSWSNLTWAHLQPASGAYQKFPDNTYIDARAPKNLAPTLTPSWKTSSAAMAAITLQRPVRIAFRAELMLKAFCS
jgi:hypothetical protein